MMKEKKTENINMKIAPSVKKLAQEMAAKKKMTLSNYIADLILDDVLRKETMMTKFLVEKVGIGGLPSSTEVFDTQDEANERAVQVWGSLTDAEKKKCHVYVTDVTEDDINPDALLRYKKEGGVFPWTEYMQSGHTDGNFNSYGIDPTVKTTKNAIEYTVRGKKIIVDISDRLAQRDAEKEQGVFDEVKFTVKCIEEDIQRIESEIGDSLFFNERMEIYKAITDFYE